MRNIVIFIAVLMMPIMTLAANKMVSEDMQKCATSAECTLVSESCQTACASIPVNTSYAAAIQQKMESCPTPVSTLPKCTVNPPLNAACINGRCTLGSAYESNGGPGDYQDKTPNAQ